MSSEIIKGLKIDTNKEKAEEIASRFKGFYVVNTSNKND